MDGYWPGPAQSVLVSMYAPAELRKNLFFQTRYAEIQNVYGESREKDAQKSYLQLRAKEFENHHSSAATPRKTIHELWATVFAFARDAGLDISEFEDPVVRKIRHVERYGLVGTDAEKELYGMYLGYWAARYRVAAAPTDRGEQVLGQMKNILCSFYTSTNEQRLAHGGPRLRAVGQ